jgi:DNA polymerase-1
VAAAWWLRGALCALPERTPRDGPVRVLLVDGLGLAFRHHYARIGNPVKDGSGRNVSAVIGTRWALRNLLDSVKPDLWALAWEKPGKKWRHDYCPSYKSNRREHPLDLTAQLPLVQEMAFYDFGLPSTQVEGEEADDVLATLARLSVEAGHQVTVHSADKDMLQLVSDEVTVTCPLSMGRTETYRPGTVLEKWGVEPDELKDLFALMGDASDGYSGASGVGRVTAAALVAKHGPIAAIYKSLDKIKPDVAAKLVSSRKSVDTALVLATLRDQLPLGLDSLTEPLGPEPDPLESAEIPE